MAQFSIEQLQAWRINHGLHPTAYPAPQTADEGDVRLLYGADGRIWGRVLHWVPRTGEKAFPNPDYGELLLVLKAGADRVPVQVSIFPFDPPSKAAAKRILDEWHTEKES